MPVCGYAPSRVRLSVAMHRAAALLRRRLSTKPPTRFDVGGSTLLIRQHFFDDGPVPQPHGSRRHADGTGLKLWPTALPLLFHLRRMLPQLRFLVSLY